jgi:hypothetical protein
MIIGFAWCLSHWSIGWTASDEPDERIFWLGPLGIVFENEGTVA